MSDFTLQNPELSKILSILAEKTETITRAQTPFEIENFIVKKHEHPFAQYRQCLIELHHKLLAYAKAERNKRLIEIDIEELLEKIEGAFSKTANELDRFELKRNQIRLEEKGSDLHHLKLLMTGTLKEIEDYDRLLTRYLPQFGKLSEEELYAKHELGYWVERISRQLQVGMSSQGMIDPGNMQLMTQLRPELADSIFQAALVKFSRMANALEGAQKTLEADRHAFSPIAPVTHLEPRKGKPEPGVLEDPQGPTPA